MSDQAPALDPKRTALLEQARDVLLGRIFPRRVQVIDTATLRGLLSP